MGEKLQTMSYYKATPLWKTSRCYLGDNTITQQRFSSIESAICAAKMDGTCLRPANYMEKYGWEFSKHGGIFNLNKTVIPLEWLRLKGYISNVVRSDDIGPIYDFL